MKVILLLACVIVIAMGSQPSDIMEDLENFTIYAKSFISSLDGTVRNSKPEPRPLTCMNETFVEELFEWEMKFE